MGMYDTFQSKDGRFAVQLKNGPCLMYVYQEGDDVGDEFEDAVYHAIDGIVVIWNGRVLSVSAHIPLTLPAGLKHLSKWGDVMSPDQSLDDLHPLAGLKRAN